MASNLPRRIAVAAVAIPAAIGVVRLGGWPFVGVLSVLGALGTREVFQMARARGVKPFGAAGMVGAALIPALAHSGRIGGPEALALAIIAIMALAVWRRPPDDGPLAAIAVTLLAPLYTAFLPTFALSIRHGIPGYEPWAATWLVFLPFVTVWVCDSVAMLVGTLMGGPKLAPTVSPNKTWSGTMGGVVGAVVAALGWGLWVVVPQGIAVSVAQLATMGLVIGVVGQLGDLAESLIKREAGLKDSGRLFGAHGGVLDRLDSLYWAVPAAAMLLAVWGIA